MKKFSLIIVCLLISQGIYARSVLNIKTKTMSVGGSIQMPLQFPKNGPTIIGLTIAPMFEYFLSRSFALTFAPSIEKPAFNAQSPLLYALALGGTYYMNLGGAIYPYIGALAGLGGQTGEKELHFELGIPLGILVALNSHVALKFGLPVTFYFHQSGYRGAHIPFGYIGVSAFF